VKENDVVRGLQCDELRIKDELREDAIFEIILNLERIRSNDINFYDNEQRNTTVNQQSVQL
jgi:hypothetical protein